MNYPNPRHLRAFTAVVQSGSLAKAALQLHIGQPALSQAIANLESLAGVRLLRRTTRSLSLTPAGEVFYRDALRVLEENGRLLAHSQQWASAQLGSVALLSIPSVAHMLVPGVVKAYALGHPLVKVHVHDHADPELRLRMQRGEGDLAIVTQGSPIADHVMLPFLSDRLRWVGNAAHPLAGRAAIEPCDLKNDQIILLRGGSVFRQMAEPLVRLIGSPLPPIEVDQVGTLVGMVSAGLGVSLIPGLSCPSEFQPNIVHRPLSPDNIFRTVGFARSPERALMPSAVKFVELFVQHLKADAQKLPPGVSFLAPDQVAIDRFTRQQGEKPL
jgi:DNA-binding transcriptional LysR family regulator